MVIQIVDRFKPQKTYVVTDATRLMEDGGIDSLGLMEVIDAVQSEFNIVLAPEDYSIENFSSVNSIVYLIRDVRKRLAPPAPGCG